VSDSAIEAGRASYGNFRHVWWPHLRNDGVMVVFIFVVDDVPMLVTGGVMVVFIFVSAT
jgi:hypothetical protein